jgi:CO/xanthine dehydrogenase Mo-binding subunit
MRGTNIPDLAFAWEAQLDMLAQRLGIDPLELRIANALTEGDATITDTVLDESVSARAALVALREPYRQAQARMAAAPADGPWRRGIGIAANWMSMGGGRFEHASGDWHGLKLGPTRAAIGLRADGSFLLRSGIVEKGQGIAVAVRQIAAAELGVPAESVEFLFGDTVAAPFPIATSGQRTMFHAGGAAQRAAHALRTAMLTVAAELLGEPAQQLSIAGGAIVSAGGGRLPLAELARALPERGLPTDYEAVFALEPSASGAGPIYAYAAQLVELDVNADTGEVRVPRVTYVADPGRVINWQTFEGQVQGGVAMGMSYAFSEGFVPGQTRTLKGYRLPSARTVPAEIDILTVQAPVDGGPFGAKGLAEMTGSAGIASGLNAVAAALGVRCYEVPCRPEIIRAAQQAHAAGGESPQPEFPEIKIAHITQSHQQSSEKE